MKSQITLTLEEYNEIKEQLELLDKLVSKKKLKRVNLTQQSLRFDSFRIYKYTLISNDKLAKELIREIKMLNTELKSVNEELRDTRTKLEKSKVEFDEYKAIIKKKNPFSFFS